MSSTGPLDDGGKVVILGGGPAGTSCALMLHRLAAEMGKRIGITIVESKQFSGGLHHNQCVGVLSPPLLSLMEGELGLPFPHQLGRAKIDGYVLHSSSVQVALSDSHPSIAVRRVLFDSYMLEAVKTRQINIVSARAVDLEVFESKIVLYTENNPVEADVLVGAFGLDEGSAAILERVTSYRRPEYLTSVVTKYHPGTEIMQALGSRIHAFLPARSRIEFAGITPKGNHLTVNIAGKSVDTRLMQSFLSRPDVSQILGYPSPDKDSESGDWRLFKGRFPYSLARDYYGDRFVVVGDAAGLVRPFKGKGVTSAVLSGIRAAKSIMETGISKQAFAADYQLANQDILGDLRYGRLARSLTIFLEDYNLLDAVLRAASQDARLRSALLGAVSGHAPYKEVLRKALSPATVWGVLRSVFRSCLPTV